MKVKLKDNKQCVTEINIDTIQFAVYNIDGDLRFWSLFEPPEDVKATIGGLQKCKTKLLELKERKGSEDISSEEAALMKEAMYLTIQLRNALKRDDVNKAFNEEMSKTLGPMFPNGLPFDKFTK